METDQPKREVTINRVFDAQVELVWRAWTDPDMLAKWWGPRGVTNPVCEVDARVGGKIHIVMLAGKEMGSFEGTRWPMTGKFIEVIPSKKLVYSGVAIEDREKGPQLETTTTVEFEAVGEKTRLTMHMVVTKATDLPQVKFAIDGMTAGWTQSLDKLGEELES
ncbi:MAG TPA: SRPBCC domain-containing protein [Candidatus Baltobacteraceae bacterium]|nr:SRPBCC domain-containing protein [Candidatus Baltobacteraceae bacterium]